MTYDYRLYYISRWCWFFFKTLGMRKVMREEKIEVEEREVEDTGKRGRGQWDIVLFTTLLRY